METCWSSVLGAVKGTGFHVQTERLGATGGKAASVETGAERVTDWWLEFVAMLCSHVLSSAHVLSRLETRLPTESNI